MKTYQLEQLDVCLPDYFRGYHKPVLQVPIYSTTTTKQELVDSILSEYNQTYDHLTYGDNAWPDLTSDELKQLADDFILTDLPFTGLDIEELEEEDDFYEPVYLFITIEEAEK